MADKEEVEVVMVVVAAGGRGGDEDNNWDIVTINRSESVSRRYTMIYNETVKSEVKVTTPPNGCMNTKINYVVCGLDTCINQCFCGLINGAVKKMRKKTSIHVQTQGLFFAAFLRELQTSLVYRLLVLQHWTNTCKRKGIKTNSSDDLTSVIIRVKIHDSLPYVLDYAWGERTCRCGQERQHLDTMMSCLSTLGGACSAMGDQLEGFAERAWGISIKQLDIALRLGDPNMVSRCRLYASISLIQQCQFKVRL